MLNRDSFAYAIENTRLHLEPSGLIDTVGQTTFDFVLVTELMDEVNRIRVRNGTIHAERPRLVAPHLMARILLEGFGERAREFADWLQEQGDCLKFLRYGFQFSKTDLREEIVDGRIEAVIERILHEVRAGEHARSAVVEGVDDAWEVCLLKLAFDTAQRSAGGNIEEWKRRGLL